jgi:long-chain acyl-CoA synthetase
MSAVLYFKGIVRDDVMLADRGARLAGGLRALGMQEGDVVAVLLRNDPAYADVIRAGQIGGTYYCPLNWHLTATELDYVLRDSGARAVIGQADLLETVRSILPSECSVLSVGAAADSNCAYESWLAAQAPYSGPSALPRTHMVYTSGTTGRPKGVRRFPIPPDQAAGKRVQMAALVLAAMGIQPGCRALISAPLYHSAPTVFAQHALDQAERLVLAERFDAEETLSLIERHRIDVVYLVPVMYTRLLKLPEAVRRRYDLSTLRFVASTGAPCAPEIKRAMIDWLGPVVTETYASSETGFITAITSAEALAHPGSAGRPVGDAEIRILDNQDNPCPVGDVGRVFVRQPAYADFTYHGQDEARRAIERDGFITLGDVGYLDAEGYLYLRDRASDMVISGGVNIYPTEIEHALLRCPGVLDCAVFGVPDEEFGERLLAVVQSELGTRRDADALIGRLRQELAGFKIPRTIEWVDALPRDDNGKVAKRRLREPYWRDRARRI